MSMSNQELETIVRMVVDRLRDSVASVGQIDQGAKSSSLRPTDHIESMAAPVATPGTLVIADRLVTLQTLGDRLAGIQTVQVSLKTIVTPAVLDELRRKGVKLVRKAASSMLRAPTTNASSNNSAAVALRIVASDEKYRVVRSVNKHVSIETLSASASEESIVEKLANVSVKAPAIWSTGRPFAAQAACLRETSLRAIHLHQASDLQRAIEQAVPNVIIVEDSRWSGFQVAKLVQPWLQANSRGGVA